MTLSRKRIDVTITLGTGQFGDSGANTVTLTGARVHVDIEALGGEAQPQAQIRIYGQPLERMNQLTAIGPINSSVMFRNSVLVAAGDDYSMKTVFSGGIWQAWADLQNAPDALLNIQCMGGLAQALKPVNALSYPGSADVATIMETLAGTMGLAFENNGVSVQLSNPYFPGTALAQVKACARAAGISFVIDRDTLAIWPRDASRAGNAVLINPRTGLIGYPAFSSNGLALNTLFNPDVRPGGTVQVESSLKVACGTFLVTAVTHSLQSETPSGQWFTQIIAIPMP